MIPEEYRLRCEGCGKDLDMRDISVLSHGWIEDGKIVCYEETLEYSKSKNINEPFEWTKRKNKIFLS